MQGAISTGRLKKALPTGGTSNGSSTPKSQGKVQKPSFKEPPAATKCKDFSDGDAHQRLDIEALKAEVVHTHVLFVYADILQEKLVQSFSSW